MTSGKALWFGYSAPFVSGNRILPLQTDERLVKNDLIQLLLTAPGDRVMRPGEGTDIRIFPFEQASVIDIARLKTSITNEISFNDGRINVVNLDIIPLPDENSVKIRLEASMVETPEKRFLVEVGIAVGDSNKQGLQIKV